MLLSKELVTLGIAIDSQELKDGIVEAFRLNFPAWTSDELVCHPDLASQFCRTIRARYGSQLPDNLILRTLINYRRAGKMPRSKE